MNYPRWMLKQIVGMLMVFLLLSSAMKPAAAQSAGFEFKIVLNGETF